MTDRCQPSTETQGDPELSGSDVKLTWKDWASLAFCALLVLWMIIDLSINGGWGWALLAVVVLAVGMAS